MGSGFWWVKILVVGFLSIFLFIFGVEVLIGTYDLKHPQLFLMFFFSGSFTILVSLVGITYPFFQVYAFFKREPDPPENDG